jgi:hypothetical protein
MTNGRRVGLIGCGLILAMVGIRPLFAQPADPAALFVAVLRGDGLLLPVATYAQGTWWNRWPFSGAASNQEVKDVSVPPTLDRLPADWLPPGTTLPRRWRLMPMTGEPRDLTVTELARHHETDIVEFIGLRTDYVGVRGGQSSHDDEVGVALAGRAVTGRFVPVTAAERTRLLPPLVAALERVEPGVIEEEIRNTVAVANTARRGVLVPSRVERQSVPLKLDAVRAERQDEARTLFYLTGSKEYRRAGTCDLSVDFSAVATRDAQGAISMSALDPVVSLDCAHDDAITASFDPLASIHWAGPTLWLVRNNSEDGFDYALFDPLRNEQLLLKDRWENRRAR